MIKRLSVRLVLWGALSLPLSGCALFQEESWSFTGGRADPTVVAPDPVTVKLSESADRAATALENLSRIEAARTVVSHEKFPLEKAPTELQEPFTVAWSGTAEALLERIAARIGYSYRALGSVPPTPLVVRVNVFEEPILEILEDVGLKLGKRAELILDSEKRRMELRYAPIVSQ